MGLLSIGDGKMSLFLAPISPVKDGGTGQIIKPATLKPYKTMTLQEVYRTITANKMCIRDSPNSVCGLSVASL